MRFLSTILCFLFFIQTVSANEGTTQSLKALYDDLQFSVTVEWDQKDSEFLKAAENRFKNGLEELRKQGLTNQELIEFAASQFRDKKAQTDFTNLMQSFQVSTLGPADMNRMVNTFIKNQYQRGASWDNFFSDMPLIGKVAYLIGITAISTGLVLAMVYGSFTGISDGTDNGSGLCEEIYTCDTYYDEYGPYENCGYYCL